MVIEVSWGSPEEGRKLFDLIESEVTVGGEGSIRIEGELFGFAVRNELGISWERLDNRGKGAKLITGGITSR